MYDENHGPGRAFITTYICVFIPCAWTLALTTSTRLIRQLCSLQWIYTKEDADTSLCRFRNQISVIMRFVTADQIKSWAPNVFVQVLPVMVPFRYERTSAKRTISSVRHDADFSDLGWVRVPTSERLAQGKTLSQMQVGCQLQIFGRLCLFSYYPASPPALHDDQRVHLLCCQA